MMNETMIEFSPKQLEYIRNANCMFNGKIGATQCGKTHLDIAYTIPTRIMVRKNKKGLIFILGVSKSTIERNILEPMREIWGETLIGYINSENKASLFGEIVYCLGTEKINQVSKLRGSRAKYIYWDEICEANEEVFELAKSRMSFEYSMCDFTANPKDPTHFIKKFTDRQDIDLYVQQWTIFDNPFLPKSFVKELCNQYRGTVYYDRYILGKWKRAEGAIYRIFADNVQDYIIDEAPNNLMGIRCAIDFGGNKSSHAFIALGFTPNFEEVVVFDEQLIDKALTPNDLEIAYVKFAKRVYNKFMKAFTTYYDNAEPVLARGISASIIKNQVATILKPALKSEINGRIRLTIRLMGAKRLKIVRKCTNLIRSFQDAVWDDKKIDDERLDNNTYCVDILDAFEYCIEREEKILLHF